MERTFHILVTNDDGVTAPGLLALAQELRSCARVTILAPDRNWSAAGHVKTMHRPLRVKEIELSDGSKALTSDGAPSDCVALALLGVVKDIDLVVSGINPHANLGYDVTYSGTVTAAMEAVIGDVPGLAVSLGSSGNHFQALDYQPAARLARKVAERLLTGNVLRDVVYNLNVPDLPEGEIGGLQVTRQGLRVYHDELVSRKDPRGESYYWIGGEAPTGVPDKGTDIGALAAGYASLTPLKLDLTAHERLDRVQKIFSTS